MNSPRSKVQSPKSDSPALNMIFGTSARVGEAHVGHWTLDIGLWTLDFGPVRSLYKTLHSLTESLRQRRQISRIRVRMQDGAME